MVFYFTATSNSLYAARQLDNELVSIAHELRNPHVTLADLVSANCQL